MARIACLLVAWTLGACSPASPQETGAGSLGGSPPPGSTGSVFGLYEGSDEALALLRTANAAGLDEMRAGGLSKKAAEHIVEARAGDGSSPHEIGALSELAGLKNVGSAAIRALFRLAERRGELGPHTHLAAADRIVAIGDMHGDFEHARAALQLAGAIDEQDHWIGGDLVVVQVGDVLDRGDGERAILDLIDRLVDEAAAAGGALVPLLGNHEIMNVAADYRYVTHAGLHAFDDLGGGTVDEDRLQEVPASQRARAAAFLPGGPVARWLARHDVAVTVGETLFVHGGLRPEHADRELGELNHDAREWMLLPGLRVPALLDDEGGPVWYRGYGTDEDVDCDELAQTLERFGAARMVIGHTVQEDGITSACDDRLFRVDVGLSGYYGGPIEVLEIGPEGTAVVSW